jgi:hypothetical protein
MKITSTSTARRRRRGASSGCRTSRPVHEAYVERMTKAAGEGLTAESAAR